MVMFLFFLGYPYYREGIAKGEMRFSVHKTVSVFFSAYVPAGSPRRHVLLSVLLKMITRETDKLSSSSDLPCVWGDIRIHIGCGFRRF